jgi:hypothetical protein
MVVIVGMAILHIGAVALTSGRAQVECVKGHPRATRGICFGYRSGAPPPRRLKGRRPSVLVVLLSLTSMIDAAETNVCKVSANPSGFDHLRVTLVGIMAGLTKSTSRGGRKDVTFLLRSPRGGGVTVFAQEPATMNNGGEEEFAAS